MISWLSCEEGKAVYPKVQLCSSEPGHVPAQQHAQEGQGSRQADPGTGAQKCLLEELASSQESSSWTMQ